MIPKPEKRQVVATRLAHYWQLSDATVEEQLEHYKPELAISNEIVTVGRVSVPRLTNVTTTGSPFALTKHTLRLMEQIGTAIEQEEPGRETI